MKFKGQALVDLGAALAGSLGTLGLALAGYGVWALVLGSLLTAAWRTIGINILAPYFARPDFSFRGTGTLLAFGGNFTLARLLWFFYSQAEHRHSEPPCWARRPWASTRSECTSPPCRSRRSPRSSIRYRFRPSPGCRISGRCSLPTS